MTSAPEPADDSSTRVPGSGMSKTALVFGILSFPLLLTWNIFLVAASGAVALVLGYLASRRIPASDDLAVRRAAGRAQVAMVIGALPVGLAVLIVVVVISKGLG